MEKDILEAMEVEKTYLYHKLNGEHIFQLADEIKKYGFESLDDYFERKRKYQFNKLNFEVIEVPPSKCISEGYRTLNEKLTSVFFVETSDTTIYVHASKPYNKSYCDTHNLTVYELPSGGGTIVSGKDDVVIAIVIPDEFNIDNTFMLNAFANILQKYEEGIEIVDNDILLNGGKVCGLTFLRGNGMIAFLAHFSFSDCSELIENICYTKDKTIKPPSYMKRLNRDILRDEVMSWLMST